jgi:1-acyl-sn-glycerol-3-phosphate acyltransferase
MGYLLSLYRLLLFSSVTFFFLWVVIIGSLFPGDRMARSFRNRGRWSSAALATLGIEVEVLGTIPEGGHLFVSNHRSYIDICVILKYVLASIVAKAEVAQWPLIGVGAKLTYTVMIKREDPESRKQTRVQVQQLLERGYSMIIFPEGTTFEGPGALPYRPGPFQIAEHGQFHIIPVAIEYEAVTDAWVGDDNFIMHFLQCFQKPRTRVKLSFGDKIEYNDWKLTHGIAQEWTQNETKRLRQQWQQYC